jgi:hypothetical protein
MKVDIVNKARTMSRIYYRPHRNHHREAAFFNALKKGFSEAKVINESYEVDPKYLNCYIKTHRLIAWLQADKLLPYRKREQCIEVLSNCPDQLKVALTTSRISFDIVVVQDEKAYYWEFHEEQHRKLPDSRRKKVFTSNGTAIEIPRYLQRLIRDVWRALYFRPYTIVWYDWFACNEKNYEPCLFTGFREFHDSENFSFQAFCQIK